MGVLQGSVVFQQAWTNESIVAVTVQSVAWVCRFELFYVIVLFNFCATAVVTVHVEGGVYILALPGLMFVF